MPHYSTLNHGAPGVADRQEMTVSSYGDHNGQSALSFRVHGYTYLPQHPQPDTGEGPYEPVTLTWHLRPSFNGDGTRAPDDLIARGAHSIYKIHSGDCGQVYHVQMNGMHIPVDFPLSEQAKLFAQNIEDLNT